MRSKEKKKMSASPVFICLLFAVCMGIAGCGGNVTKGDIATRGGMNAGKDGTANRAASGGAVSGSTVSGGAVRGEQEEKKTKYRYATDTNYYYQKMNGENFCIMQERRDGHQEKMVFEREVEDGDFCWLEYVAEHALYYSCWSEKKESTLYRIPLKKDVGGQETAELSRQEELAAEKFDTVHGYTDYLCWDSRYVIYMTYQKDEGRELVKYDLQEKKECSREPFEKLGLGGTGEMSVGVFRLRDSYVLLADKGAVCVMEADGTEWSECEPYKTIGMTYCTQTQHNVFYTPTIISGSIEEKLVWKCDGRKTECLVTAEQLEQAVKEAKKMGETDKLDDFGVNGLYMSGDRLYLECGLNWKADNVYRMEYLMFSMGEEDSKLRYEKELTECMQSHVKTRTGIWGESRKKVLKESVVVNDAQCIAIMNGSVYLSLYDYEKDRGRMGCYELQSGQFRWVSEEEASHGELRYSGMYDGPEQEIKSVFEKEWDNQYIGPWGMPSEDTEVTGDFYETEE